MTAQTKPSFRTVILAALASLAVFSVTYVIFSNINLFQPILKNYYENVLEENELSTSLVGQSTGGDGAPTINDDDGDVDGHLDERNTDLSVSFDQINGDASNHVGNSDSYVDANIAGDTEAEQSNDALDQKNEIESSDIIGVDNRTMMEIKEFRTKRIGNFDAWFDDSEKLFPNIDVDGPILDFAISGKFDINNIAFLSDQLELMENCDLDRICKVWNNFDGR